MNPTQRILYEAACLIDTPRHDTTHADVMMAFAFAVALAGEEA